MLAARASLRDASCIPTGNRLGTFIVADAATSYLRPNTSRRSGPPFTSRVCSTEALGPSSRRTSSSASRIVLARYVFISMAYYQLCYVLRFIRDQTERHDLRIPRYFVETQHDQVRQMILGQPLHRRTNLRTHKHDRRVTARRQLADLRID